MKDIRLVSSLLVDADLIRFGGFRLKEWRRFRNIRPGRRNGMDAIEVECRRGVLIGRGILAGGTVFTCDERHGTLRIPDIGLNIVSGYTGDLVGMITAPLFTQRPRRVVEASKVAGGTVIRFDCYALSGQKFE